MKIKRAKKESVCECGGIIEKGETCILTEYHRGKYHRRWLYHTKCYIQHLEDRIAVWEVYHPRPMIREKTRIDKIPTIDRVERRRKTALYRYHRSKGNVKRMNEVALEIQQLSYGIPYHATV